MRSKTWPPIEDYHWNGGEVEDNQSRVMVQWLPTRGRLAFSSPTCLVVEEGAAAAAAALSLVPSPATAAPGAHIIDVVGAAPDSASQFSLREVRGAQSGKGANVCALLAQCGRLVHRV